MHFFEVEQREPKEIVPGVRIRTAWGDKMLLSIVDIDPGASVPNHSHPHEQAGAVLSGVITMTIADEERELGPGESYVIPGGVEHSAVGGPDGVRVMDVFSPVREEYQY
ncbi:MAG: cupin domain-containing protein [Anaerolineales bacterium]